jgi:thioredoxin 1
MVKNLTTEQFKDLIFDYTKIDENSSEFKYKGDKPCIIDFYAEWCGPCKALAPILNELSSEYENVDFFKINTETEDELSEVFNIRSIPTLLFIPIDEQPQINMGMLQKEALKQVIDDFLLK